MTSRQHNSCGGGGGTSSVVNLALVGALGSGKSALTVKYITKRFINEYDPFLEDTYTKHESLDGQEVSVRIMDTCDKGSVDPERYLKWADGYLVVYSITDPESFETAGRYLDAISNHLRAVSSYETPMVLVGNKSDLERYRQVSAWEGRRLARRHESTFFETSAAEGDWDSVAEAFREAARQVLREQERFVPLLRPLFIEETAAHPSGAERHRRSPAVDGSKGRKDSRGEQPPSGTTSNLTSPANTRFSFLKGIVPLKGIFQSTGGNGGTSPNAVSNTIATTSSPSNSGTAATMAS